MPQKIVAGNWKMNLNRNQALELATAVINHTIPEDVRVMLFPSSIFASEVASIAGSKADVGVQNFFYETQGAFTGEIAIEQVLSAGATIGLVGHSERRGLFSESDELLKSKVDAALANGLEFIFCCGEPIEIREANAEMAYVKSQLEASLFHLTKEQMQGRVIAYEPIWAIGTGRTASSDQAEEMHSAIRSWLVEKYDLETAQSVSILYGGSCNQNNAQELFSRPNVDGGLIGGAALDATAFGAIIDSF